MKQGQKSQRNFHRLISNADIGRFLNWKKVEEIATKD